VNALLVRSLLALVVLASVLILPAGHAGFPLGPADDPGAGGACAIAIQVYSYTVRSYDATGNLHLPSDGVSVQINSDPLPEPDLFLPLAYL